MTCWIYGKSLQVSGVAGYGEGEAVEIRYQYDAGGKNAEGSVLVPEETAEEIASEIQEALEE